MHNERKLHVNERDMHANHVYMHMSRMLLELFRSNVSHLASGRDVRCPLTCFVIVVSCVDFDTKKLKSLGTKGQNSKLGS